MSNGIPEGKRAISSPLFVARIVCREKLFSVNWACLRPVRKCFPEVLGILFATGESYRLIRGVCIGWSVLLVAPEWLFLSGDMGAVMDGFVGAPVPAERVDPSICVLNDDDRKRIGLIWISGTMSDRIVPESQGP